MGVKISFYLESPCYQDIEGLSSPLTENFPIGVTNNETAAKYIRAQLVSPPAGWGSYDVQLGSVAAGTSTFLIFSPTRTTPTLTAGEYEESLTLRISVYNDAGYSELYGSAELTFTMSFFDSTDPAWTVVDIDNFDDGTLEGWAMSTTGIIDESCPNSWASGARTEHFITSPYSLGIPAQATRDHCYKDFTVGNVTKARLVVHAYLETYYYGGFLTMLALQRGSDLILPGGVSRVMPHDVWIRLSYSFPVNATTRLRYAVNYIDASTPRVWLDKIKIIRK